MPPTTPPRPDLLEELVTVLRARERTGYSLPTRVVALLRALEGEEVPVDVQMGWAR